MSALLNKIWEEAQKLLKPHMTKIEYPRFLREDIIEISVKTYRTPTGPCEDDCDGTAWPDEDADKAARQIAVNCGIKFESYEPVEKGWGAYLYKTNHLK